MEAPPSLAAVTKTNLRNEVLTALRDAIISGEMRPGELYSAPELAKRLKVSSTPIREAMVNLAEEGLIVALPNRGYQVTTVSDADLQQIVEIRLLLEPPIAASVTALIPDEDIPTLRKLAHAIVDHAENGRLAAFIEADREFHLAVLCYSNNPRLIHIVEKLRMQTRLLGLRPLLDHGDLLESAKEHLEMVALIEKRDADAVEESWKKHIGHVLDIWSAPS